MTTPPSTQQQINEVIERVSRQSQYDAAPIYQESDIQTLLHAAKAHQELTAENAELRDRLIKEHLPKEYKTWEQVWQRQIEILKENQSLSLQVAQLGEALNEVVNEVDIIVDAARMEKWKPALSTLPSPSDWVRRDVAEKLFLALQYAGREIDITAKCHLPTNCTASKPCKRCEALALYHQTTEKGK